MINLKKKLLRLKNFHCEAVLRRDFMINRLEKNADNNYEEFACNDCINTFFCAQKILCDHNTYLHDTLNYYKKISFLRTLIIKNDVE